MSLIDQAMQDAIHGRPMWYDPNRPGAQAKIAEDNLRNAIVKITGQESDPTGRKPSDPGAKLDDGKPLPWLVLSSFAPALQKVVAVGTDGARKYSPDGWLSVPDGERRYKEALMRHLLADMAGEELDASGHEHLAHVAWNILAVMTLKAKK